MNQGKPKNSFWSGLAISLAIIGAALLGLWFLLPTHIGSEHIEKTMNAAAQNQIQQLALTMVAYAANNDGQYASDWTSLADYGYRPDPNVRVLVMIINLGWGANQRSGYVVKANHAVKGSGVYFFSNIVEGALQPLPKTKRLGDEYAMTVADGRRESDESSGQAAGGAVILKGPPIMVIRVPWREPVRAADKS